ncbi:Protein kinase [uncultured virus]|nr:Protein kinase [uncultured virus]
MSFLGEGGFGAVYSKDGMAIKKFKKLSHLVQEVCVTVHMRDSDYTLKIIECDFSLLTMSSELWHCSLSHAMVRHRFTLDEKRSVLKNILLGLRYIHSRYMIHADVRSANILVDNTYRRAIIADFGLTSIDDCAKVRQTAKNFQPYHIVNEMSHDMYGLAVTMTELFGGATISSRLGPTTLKKLIEDRVKPLDVRDAVISMVPDDHKKSTSVDDILLRLFRIEREITPDRVYSIRNKISSEVTEHIKSTVKKLGSKFLVDTTGQAIKKTEYGSIKKKKRCIECIIFFLNRHYKRAAKKLESHNVEFTIKCMMFIFSSIFGSRGYSENNVIKGSEKKLVDVHKKIADIIRDPAVIDLIFAP